MLPGRVVADAHVRTSRLRIAKLWVQGFSSALFVFHFPEGPDIVPLWNQGLETIYGMVFGP